MKTKFNLFGFVLIQALFLFSVSCSEDIGSDSSLIEKNGINLTVKEYASVAFDNPKELDEEAILSIAEAFVKNVKVKTRSSVSMPSISIKSKTYIDANNSEIKTKSSSVNFKIPLYEVAILDNGEEGFMLVSGDERAQKVIAYIPLADEENFSINTNAQILRGLCIGSLISNIEEVEQLKDSLRDQTLEKIGNELGIEKEAVVFDEVKEYVAVNENPITKFTAIQTPPSVLLSYVSPLCRTQWHQLEPYNLRMDFGWVKNYSFQRHYLAGCGPISVAQILATIRPSMICSGTTIDWAYLKQTSKISEKDPVQKTTMVSNLVKECFDGVSARYKIKNGINESTSSYESDLVYFLRRYANTGLSQPWDASVVYNSLVVFKPVLITAQGIRHSDNKPVGHAFILDGFLKCQKYYGLSTANGTGTGEFQTLINNYDCYFHTNLGWGGSYDGYYLIEKNSSVYFQTPSSSYHSDNIRILPDISRK